MINLSDRFFSAKQDNKSYSEIKPEKGGPTWRSVIGSGLGLTGTVGSKGDRAV